MNNDFRGSRTQQKHNNSRANSNRNVQHHNTVRRPNAGRTSLSRQQRFSDMVTVPQWCMRRAGLLWLVTAAAMVVIIPLLGLTLLKTSFQLSLEGKFDAYLASIMPKFIITFSYCLQVLFSSKISLLWLAVIAGVWYWKRRVWQELLLLGIAVAIPMAYVFLIKLLVNRPRPVSELAKHLHDSSFPSGHTAIAATVATLVYVLLRERIHYVAALVIVGAVIVALSRCILQVHFFTDVFTSLIICPLIVLSLATLFKKVA